LTGRSESSTYSQMASDEHIPAAAQDLVALGQRMVHEVIGVEPDLTPDTLPLVDQYLRQVPPELAHETRALVVSAVGCYFGEVVRRTLNGRWVLAAAEPSSWRVELSSCFLYFSPVGMAGEVLAGEDSDDYDGSFSTSDDLRDDLSAALNAAGPVPEDEYYSLCGRIDVLELVADWLTGKRMASGKPVHAYSEEDYRAVIERGR
jgi:hypothetical protein